MKKIVPWIYIIAFAALFSLMAVLQQRGAKNEAELEKVTKTVKIIQHNLEKAKE